MVLVPPPGNFKTDANESARRRSLAKSHGVSHEKLNILKSGVETSSLVSHDAKRKHILSILLAIVNSALMVRPAYSDKSNNVSDMTGLASHQVVKVLHKAVSYISQMHEKYPLETIDVLMSELEDSCVSVSLKYIQNCHPDAITDFKRDVFDFLQLYAMSNRADLRRMDKMELVSFCLSCSRSTFHDQKKLCDVVEAVREIAFEYIETFLRRVNERDSSSGSNIPLDMTCSRAMGILEMSCREGIYVDRAYDLATTFMYAVRKETFKLTIESHPLFVSTAFWRLQLSVLRIIETASQHLPFLSRILYEYRRNHDDVRQRLPYFHNQYPSHDRHISTSRGVLLKTP